MIDLEALRRRQIVRRSAVRLLSLGIHTDSALTKSSKLRQAQETG